jgi:hypothetical protein
MPSHTRSGSPYRPMVKVRELPARKRLRISNLTLFLTPESGAAASAARPQGRSFETSSLARLRPFAAGRCTLTLQLCFLRPHAGKRHLELLAQRMQSFHGVAGPNLGRYGGPPGAYRELRLKDCRGYAVVSKMTAIVSPAAARVIGIIARVITSSMKIIRTIYSLLGQQLRGQVLSPEHFSLRAKSWTCNFPNGSVPIQPERGRTGAVLRRLMDAFG